MVKYISLTYRKKVTFFLNITYVSRIFVFKITFICMNKRDYDYRQNRGDVDSQATGLRAMWVAGCAGRVGGASALCRRPPCVSRPPPRARPAADISRILRQKTTQLLICYTFRELKTRYPHFKFYFSTIFYSLVILP